MKVLRQDQQVHNTEEIRTQLNPPETMESIEAKVQNRLDEFARTKFYDNIFTAISYENDEDPIFSAEASRCKHLRSLTWTTCRTLLMEYQMGERVINGYGDIEPLLPELTWED